MNVEHEEIFVKKGENWSNKCTAYGDADTKTCFEVLSSGSPSLTVSIKSSEINSIESYLDAVIDTTDLSNSIMFRIHDCI